MSESNLCKPNNKKQGILVSGQHRHYQLTPPIFPPIMLLFPPAAWGIFFPPPSSLPSSPSSSSFPLPKRPETTRTPKRSSSNITHSRVGLGRIVERHARVKALALAHLSSASPCGKVPRAMVLPAHYIHHHTSYMMFG